MQSAAHCVEAPLEHIEQGIIAVTTDEQGRPFDWIAATGGILRIHSCKRKPSDVALAIKHNDYWFYIAADDLDSRKTFRLLVDIVDLQLKAGVPGGGPVLTLSVGK